MAALTSSTKMAYPEWPLASGCEAKDASANPMISKSPSLEKRIQSCRVSRTRAKPCVTDSLLKSSTLGLLALDANNTPIRGWVERLTFRVVSTGISVSGTSGCFSLTS